MQPGAAILSAHFPKEEAAKVRACARRAGKTTSRYLYELWKASSVVESEDHVRKRRGDLRVIRGGKR